MEVETKASKSNEEQSLERSLPIEISIHFIECQDKDNFETDVKKLAEKRKSICFNHCYLEWESNNFYQAATFDDIIQQITYRC